MWLRLVPPLCLLWLAGCASLSPRFPSNIAASLAREPMRRMETRSLELYYPEASRAEALRVAARLEGCVDLLRAKAPVVPREKLLVVVTGANFNNAYVASLTPGQPQQMVLPNHVTLEMFSWFQLGNVSDVACHEAVHYVQLQQVGAGWRVLNTLSGGLLQPNILSETWFLEGLATWYEGRLGHRTGRPNSPIFRGWWESGVASEAWLDAGFLNPANRAVQPFGANYQTGMAFVEWLAATYGEERLWEYVESVGSSATLNLGLTLRFKSVFGKSIGAAFDEFNAHLKRTLPKRARPADQHVVAEDLGFVARLATSPADGAMAVLFQGRDQVPTLRVWERDGRLRLDRWLTPLFPERAFLAASPTVVSGLRFSSDGGALFAVLGDVDEEGNDVSRLLSFDARTGALRRIWDGLSGLGGDVTPDGRGYVYVEVQHGTSNLVRLDLATGTKTALTAFPAGTTLAPPAVSPDGRRIVFPRWMNGQYDLVMREEDGGLRVLTQDVALDYAPRWVDARRVVFLRESEGRGQVALLDVDGATLTLVTDAPYLAFDPGPLGDGRVAFLNREAWHWTLDTAPLPEVLEASARAAPVVHAPSPELELPQTREVEVLSDAPYSSLDGLFLPQLHLPFVTNLRVGADEQVALSYGLSLEGADRLSRHTYALNLTFDTERRGPSIAAGYGNFQLAPWFLSAGFNRTPFGPRTDWTASLSASRSFWTTPVAFSLLGFQRDVRPGVLDAGPAGRLGGPRIAMDYFAADSTSDGGLHRAVGVNLQSAVYATNFANRFAVGDVRLDLFGAVPTPFDDDSLTLRVMGRALPNAPAGLLRVGGVSPQFSNLALGWPVNRFEEPLPSLGNLAFVEPLRGYEDVQLAATRLALATARYRYSFVIDHGWASFLYVLPSFFLRQVDVDAFATWAMTDTAGTPLGAPEGNRNHRVGGGSVALRTSFGSAFPVSIRYQVAVRADDGLPPLHLVSVAFE